MNRILFEERADSYTLDPRDPRFEHVRGVLRMRTGDSFDVGLINGPAGKATIRELDEGVMRVDVAWGAVPEPPPPIDLLVGMCRPATVRKILTTAPTLGVRSLHFASSGRSDPAYAQASLWKGDEWRRLVVEGTEQAFDTHVPEVARHSGLTEAMASLSSDSLRLALDVYEGTGLLSDRTIPQTQAVCLAVGPERGWNQHDRATLREAGFELVSLNERVLRVETAVTVGLTLVLNGMGRL